MSCNIVITSDDEGDYRISLSNSVSNWSLVPEPVFLTILNYLSARDILSAGECCRRWNDITKDDYLWKKIFQRDFKVDSVIGLKPGVFHIYMLSAHCTKTYTRCMQHTQMCVNSLSCQVDIVVCPCPSNPIYNWIDIGFGLASNRSTKVTHTHPVFHMSVLIGFIFTPFSIAKIIIICVESRMNLMPNEWNDSESNILCFYETAECYNFFPFRQIRRQIEIYYDVKSSFRCATARNYFCFHLLPCALPSRRICKSEQANHGQLAIAHRTHTTCAGTRHL